MAKGVLGIVICPMVDDNLIYSLKKDADEKRIMVIQDDSNGSICRKLTKAGIGFEIVSWEWVTERRIGIDPDAFNILIRTIDLGLHSKPEVLKTTVEDIARDLQPYVDAIGFYLGTCGNFEWNIPQWCEEQGFKPSAMFCDSCGNLCHDCVGINIAGGPKYNELQKTYFAHMYIFPAMASNFDDFMNADQAEAAATEASLTDDMRETLGIEPGRDGYFRWLLSLAGYQNILKIDTGLEDPEVFDRDIAEVAKRMGLNVRIADEGWADLQPTDDLYEKSKSFLAH